MLCENCKKNQATTHIKTNINGLLEEHNLCSECAQAAGYTQAGFGFSDLLESFFGDALASHDPLPATVRCSGCGMSFSDIADSGRVGCDRCYETFLDRLVPSLERMHGKIGHAGKIPHSAGPTVTAQSKLEQLRSKLSEAIAAEEFEKAAEIRDQIKELEGHE